MTFMIFCGAKTSALISFLFCSPAEITMFDGYIVIYKFIADLHFFVSGGDDENELIISTVLQAFFDAVGILLRCCYFISISGFQVVDPIASENESSFRVRLFMDFSIRYYLLVAR